MIEPDPPVLTPVVIKQRASPLLPAIRDDLAPFTPALRGAVQLLMAAAVAEFAAHYAAPAIVELARQKLSPPLNTQTILVEEHTTVRRRITVVS